MDTPCKTCKDEGYIVVRASGVNPFGLTMNKSCPTCRPWEY